MEFNQRIVQQYAEIFNSGTNEGHDAEEHFEIFGWYATIKKLAKNNVLKINKVLALEMHECLLFLACEISETKIKIKEMNKTAGKNMHQL